MANKTTTQARHEIAQAALDAKRVIDSATAEALKVSSIKEKDNYELWIRMDEKLSQVIKDVADIKTNTVGRVEKLELNSIDKEDHEKVMNDIAVLKSWKAWTLGFGIGLTCIMGIAGLLIAYIFTNHVETTDANIASLRVIITSLVNK